MVGVVVLLVAGLGPALYLVSRGSSVNRLVGLQLAGVVGVLVLIALPEAVGQPIYLMVPLVLAVLTATGTLVFTRMLRRDRDVGGPTGGEHD